MKQKKLKVTQLQVIPPHGALWDIINFHYDPMCLSLVPILS